MAYTHILVPAFRLFILLAAATAGTAVMAAPARPSDDAVVLATIPAGRSAPSSNLRLAEAELSREPGNLKLAVRVARLAIDEGRNWSDPRRYGQAQAALAPWWNDSHPPEEARVLRAVILQALHDFKPALADLDAIIEQTPRNAQARLTRAFVRLVVGDVKGAAQDCRSLPDNIISLAVAACRSRVEALSGAGAQSYERLRQVLERDGQSTAAMRRFALSIIADMAIGLGRNDDAGRYFKEAAAIGDSDVPLLAATADYLLDNGRAAEVLPLLDGKGNADVLILRRTIAAKRTGDPRLAEWAAILNERFAAARAGGVNAHLREEARFRLEIDGNAAAALALATENWNIQKEPADARLVVESAIAAGEPAAAGGVARFARETGLHDNRVTPLLSRLEIE
jgi:tetratricopeptide (TPR) repeat protein